MRSATLLIPLLAFGCGLTGTAAAGDTVEIVQRIDGRGRGRQAGIVVRASARFCAVQGRGGERVHVPVTRLLTPAGSR